MLVKARASLRTRAPGMPELMGAPDFTPLHLAAWFGSHNLHVLEALLELRADPNDSTVGAAPPLHYCRTVGAVDLLIRYGAGVNFQGTSRQDAQSRPWPRCKGRAGQLIAPAQRGDLLPTTT